MSASPARLTGGCLCGAVRFTAAPRHLHVDTCHCGMCRRWSAGPMFTLDCTGTLEIEDTTHLGVYRSSEWAERCFCKQCGTSLFYRLVGKDLCAVSAETIDDKSGFVFTTQIFVDEKPAYYDFANKTKMMTGSEVFAAFAGEAKG
jgi:hypothetical protein